MIDCGNHNCILATTNGGMRTNAHCRCLQALPVATRREVERRLAENKKLIARCQELEAENKALREELLKALKNWCHVECQPNYAHSCEKCGIDKRIEELEGGE
jgi:predicted nuclease with TOPRIM domain